MILANYTGYNLGAYPDLTDGKGSENYVSKQKCSLSDRSTASNKKS